MTSTHVYIRGSALAAALAAAACLAVTAGTAGARPRAACANARRPVRTLSLAAVRASVLCLINQQRTERGLPPLRNNRRLDRVAEHWSGWMVAHRDFSHGSNWTARFGAVGYQWQTAAENIASGPRTPAALVRAWMRSRFHCRNILYPGFSDVGLGETLGVIGRRIRGGATWTQDFGLPLFAFPASQNTRPMNGCPYA